MSASVKNRLDIVWENAHDITHFLFLHRKRFKQVEVLFDDGTFRAMYYTAKVLYPLPFANRYIVIRNILHAEHRVLQVYKDLDRGMKTFLDCSVFAEGDVVTIRNEFLFQVSGLLGRVPGFFANMVRARVMAMWHEDLELLHGRFDLGGFDHKSCAPDFRSLGADLRNFSQYMCLKDDPGTAHYSFMESA